MRCAKLSLFFVSGWQRRGGGKVGGFMFYKSLIFKCFLNSNLPPPPLVICKLLRSYVLTRFQRFRTLDFRCDFRPS